MSADVLILGAADAGKTHYAGQLLGRLRHSRTGALRLLPGGADDLSKFEEVLSCLEEGRSAGHTSGNTWVGMKLQIESRAGARITLEWLDYAGEKLTTMLHRRTFLPEWKVALAGASAWFLLIRPSTLKTYEDLVSRPTAVPGAAAQEGLEAQQSWDDRARYVELLQMLLFAKQVSLDRAISSPRLCVALSCWDEISSEAAPVTPEAVLQNRLPLLHSFIRANWNSDAWSVWGLSSLGRRLDPKAADPAFASEGPDSFGYVVAATSTTEESDLTKPLEWLISKASP